MFINIFGFNRFSSVIYKLIAFLLVQQLIAASSSIWIVDFVNQVKAGEGWQLPLGLFLLSMILPYLPGAVALHLTNIWSFEAQSAAVDQHIRNTHGRVELFGNDKIKNEQLVQISKDLPQFISDFTQFAYQFLASSLNFALQVLAVSYLLGINFLCSMIVGAILMYIYVLSNRKKNKEMAFVKQTAQSNLAQSVTSSWDNLTLKNQYNCNLWSNRLQERLQSLGAATRSFSLSKEFGGAMISLIGFMPTVLFMYFSIISGSPTVSELLALSVLLPRVFQIFNTSTGVIILINNIGFMKGQWHAIAEKQSHLEATTDNLQERIQFSKISIRNNQTGTSQNVDSFETLLKWAQAAVIDKGWYTIIGPNGSGKSTALLCIKKSMQNDSIYLPANFNLSFAALEGARHSTGQKVSRAVDEILTLPELRILLLDEWDANLDHTSIADIHAKIAIAAKNHLVLDVSHRNTVS